MPMEPWLQGRFFSPLLGELTCLYSAKTSFVNVMRSDPALDFREKPADADRALLRLIRVEGAHLFVVSFLRTTAILVDDSRN
jgi:hypothetical protein